MTYLVLGEHIDEVLLFKVGHLVLVHRIVVLLRDRVVYHVLSLHELVGYLLVSRLFKLNVAFLVHVISHIVLPVLNSVVVANHLADSAHVSCHFKI